MAKKYVRVVLRDDSARAFAIDERSRAAELKAALVAKLQLDSLPAASFALYERLPGCPERYVEADERPCAVMAAWPATEAPGSPSSRRAGAASAPDDPAAFVFKKRLFLRPQPDAPVDAVSLSLEYMQAVHGVVNSHFAALSVDDAIKLGGLAVHAAYGIHQESVHQPGFLAAHLRRFVPHELWPAKKPAEWEASLLAEHARHKALTTEQTHTAFIRLLSQCVGAIYGTTFWPVKPAPPNPQKPVLLGVNCDGFLLVNMNHQVLSAHSFTQVAAWSHSPAFFAFELGADAQKYYFETGQGAAIAQLATDYVDALAQQVLQRCQPPSAAAD